MGTINKKIKLRMESFFTSAPAEKAPEFQQKDIMKEGFLDKQSRYLKSWRKRYVILIKTHLLTFKDNMNRGAPTEIIPINNCCTVKSADDELNVKNTFKVLVQDRTFYFMGADNSDKESWIGALGKAMIKSSVLIDDNLDGAYM